MSTIVIGILIGATIAMRGATATAVMIVVGGGRIVIESIMVAFSAAGLLLPLLLLPVQVPVLVANV
jgi:ABC-type transport system involved in cytochrome c biogenesis permease component